MTMMDAVPRSLPISTNKMATPATGAIGSATCRQSPSSSSLVDSTQAIHTMSAILTNSDGCMLKPPMEIQFWLPPCSRPSPGMKTMSCSAPPTRSAGHAQRFQNRGGIREATSMSGMPRIAENPCRMNRPKKPSPSTLDSMDDDDSTITRPNATRNRVVPRSRK